MVKKEVRTKIGKRVKSGGTRNASKRNEDTRNL